MANINIINCIKNLLTDYLTLIKIGNFYEAYNDDAKILSYLFNYKLKTIDHVYAISDFSVIAINKVKVLLEINYFLVDKKHNYEEIEKVNFKRKNKYYSFKEIAINHVDIVNRIEKNQNIFISQYFKNN